MGLGDRPAKREAEYGAAADGPAAMHLASTLAVLPERPLKVGHAQTGSTACPPPCAFER
jgi:hypothetical protein